MTYSFYFCNDFVNALTGTKTKHQDWEAALTLEALRGGGGGRGKGQIDPHPSIFLALNFCSLTDCQKLWHNCSLFVNTSFDSN